MREFYPFMRVQVSTITMRENIFRYFMARTNGSHGSHVWLAWLAYWQLSLLLLLEIGPLSLPSPEAKFD